MDIPTHPIAPFTEPAKRVSLRSPEELDFVRSRRELTPQQRVALNAVVSSATIAEAHRKLTEAGVEISKMTLHRWARRPAFVKAWNAMMRVAAKRITKDSVLVKTEHVLERAMAGTPIVGEVPNEQTGVLEERIIGWEPQLGHALKAIELQGKAVGAWGDEQQKIAVVVDIDFSGRAEGGEANLLKKADALDAEFAAAADIPDWLG